MKGRIKDHGIILRLSQYGESSVIAQVLARDHGAIGFIAKGIRQKNNSQPLLPLSQYELTLYEPLESGLFLFNEASLSKERIYADPKLWSVALCGAELIGGLVVAADEHKLYYDLLSSFLDYLTGFDDEPLPIFWRLFLRVMKLQGLSLETDRCLSCDNACSPFAYHKRDAALLCEGCASLNHSDAELCRLSPRASELLRWMPEIGRYLSDLKLDRAVVRELNEFFSYYYQAHTHQTLKLKSLSVLEQLY